MRVRNLRVRKYLGRWASSGDAKRLLHPTTDLCFIWLHIPGDNANIPKYLRFCSGTPLPLPRKCAGIPDVPVTSGRVWSIVVAVILDWSPYIQTPCRTPPQYHGPDETPGSRGHYLHTGWDGQDPRAWITSPWILPRWGRHTPAAHVLLTRFCRSCLCSFLELC